MKIKIYIDVLFAVNVWMNVGLLFLTGMWFGYKSKGLRLFLGAAVGGLWSCFLAAFWILPRWGSLLLTYGVIGPLMCTLAFGRKKGRALVRLSSGFSVISIFAGGFLSQLYFHTGMGYVMGKFMTVPLLLMLAVITFLVIRETIKFVGNLRREKTDLCEVTLIRGDIKVKVTALMDTGNCLYEPATGLPVSVGEEKVLRPLFPEDEGETGFFWIPYHSIGGNGFLKGKLLDAMIIQGKEDGKDLENGPVMVALKEGKLSGDGSYQLILHGDFAGFTACERKRRRSNDHQGISSKQVSAENHFQYEEPYIFKEK